VYSVYVLLCAFASYLSSNTSLRALLWSMTDEVDMKTAAAMLGVSKDKLARMVKAGKLTARPSVLDARRKLIPRQQVEDLLKAEGRS
jgi:excisionase family DNA binding protein